MGIFILPYSNIHTISPHCLVFNPCIKTFAPILSNILRSAHACLSADYLEEIILFPRLLPYPFTLIKCNKNCVDVLWMVVLFYDQKC